MTIHRLTTNIILFALGLNIALASASPRIPASHDCDSAVGCVHQELKVAAIKISRPVRSRDQAAADQKAGIEITYG